MNQNAAHAAETAVEAGDLGQNAGSSHHRDGDQAAHQSGQCPPFDGTKEVQPKSFQLAIERIGLDEEPHPDAIEKSINRSQNETVNDVADQRAEQCGALVGGPVERLMAQEREDREWAKEPQENPESQAPAHAGAVAADVPLKEDPENCPDQQGYKKVQHDSLA